MNTAPWMTELARWAAPAVAWMLTYLLHSTLLLGAAWLLGRSFGDRRLAVQETTWKAAVVGGVLTATLQLGLGVQPLAGSWALPEATPAASVAELSAAHGTAAVDMTFHGPAVATEPAAFDATGAEDETLLSASLPDAAAGADRDVTAVAATAFDLPISEPAGAVAAAAPAPPGLLWLLATAAAWLAVAAGLLFSLGFAYLRLTRSLAGRRPVREGAVGALFGRLLARTGRRRPVILSASERLGVPIAWGLTRPEISLPERVVAELSPYHQESILAHELSHVLRRDPAWLVLCRGVESALFFQPLNRVARRRLQEIAEYRCDDRAVELTGRPLELARCLTEVAAWRLAARSRLPVPSMAADGSGLAARVRRLLDRSHRGSERAPRWIWALAATALLTVAAAAPGVSGQAPAPDAPPAPPAPPTVEAPQAPPTEPSAAALPAPEAPPTASLPTLAGEPATAPSALPALPAPATAPSLEPMLTPAPEAPPALPALPEPVVTPGSEPTPATAPRPSTEPRPVLAPRADSLQTPRADGSSAPAPLPNGLRGPMPAPSGAPLPTPRATALPDGVPRPGHLSAPVAPRANGSSSPPQVALPALAQAGRTPRAVAVLAQADAPAPRAERRREDSPAEDLERAVSRLMADRDEGRRAEIAQRLAAELEAVETRVEVELDRHEAAFDRLDESDDHEAAEARTAALEAALEALDEAYGQVVDDVTDDVPEEARAEVEAELRAHLGEAFAARHRLEAELRSVQRETSRLERGAGADVERQVRAEQRQRAEEMERLREDMRRSAEARSRDAERERRELAEEMERVRRELRDAEAANGRVGAQSGEVARDRARLAQEAAAMAQRQEEEMRAEREALRQEVERMSRGSRDLHEGLSELHRQQAEEMAEMARALRDTARQAEEARAAGNVGEATRLEAEMEKQQAALEAQSEKLEQESEALAERIEAKREAQVAELEQRIEAMQQELEKKQEKQLEELERQMERMQRHREETPAPDDEAGQGEHGSR